MNKHHFTIEKLIDDIKDTDKDLGAALEYYKMIEDDLSDEDRAELNQSLFICHHCGWWIERNHENASICEDCSELNFTTLCEN
jgi:hypothetical protein